MEILTCRGWVRPVAVLSALDDWLTDQQQVTIAIEFCHLTHVVIATVHHPTVQWRKQLRAFNCYNNDIDLKKKSH